MNRRTLAVPPLRRLAPLWGVLGVVLLLFTIGLEISLSRIVGLGRTVAQGGGAQVGLTLTITAIAAILLGLPWNRAVFVGALMALSFVLGAMNLAWMAALTLVMGAERLLPDGTLLSRDFGVAFLVWGAVRIVSAF